MSVRIIRDLRKKCRKRQRGFYIFSVGKNIKFFLLNLPNTIDRDISLFINWLIFIYVAGLFKGTCKHQQNLIKHK